MRWAVIVNGPPGSGKTTTAHALAAVLRLPVFSKDAVKETLLDELGYASREDSRAIGAASGEVVWTLLRDCPAPAIVESWLAPHTRDIVRAGLRRAAVERVIEVWCSCPSDENRRRYAERERHPGHYDAALLPELDEVLRTAEPLGLGAVCSGCRPARTGRLSAQRGESVSPPTSTSALPLSSTPVTVAAVDSCSS